MLKNRGHPQKGVLHGIELGQVVRVVTIAPLGPDAVTIYYKTADSLLITATSHNKLGGQAESESLACS